MTISFSTDKLVKVIQFALLVAILSLLVWSAPWNSNNNSSERTITVTGETTIKAVPDEFTFSPYFQESGMDKDVIKTSLTKKTNATVEKLTELGVKKDNITLDASSYDNWYYRANEEGTLTINLKIVVSDKGIAQKVQNYLLTLDVKGQISPRASFSKAKQKTLDAQAVEEASNDAKSKAETQANLFNAKLGKALTINQGSDSIFFGLREVVAQPLALKDSPTATLPVLPGRNEYNQKVTVVYELL